MKTLIIFCLRASFLVFLFSCNEKNASNMYLLDSGHTGIVFNNQIQESDSLNILKQQYIYNGGGVAAGDFNNDGLTDLYFTGNMVSNSLYLNKGNMQFREIGKQAGVDAVNRWSSGVALVDINCDGWLDLYVCATFSPDSTYRKNQFFINQGNNSQGLPTFIDRAEAMGVADSGHSTHAVFLDYDKDGDLDLFVIRNISQTSLQTYIRKKIEDGSSPTTDRLYRNNGDATFTDISQQAGISLEGYSLGVAILDVNDDHYPDLYISNDFITNDILYVNQKDGTFKNQFDDFFKHQSFFSMGSDAGDINNDGAVDVMTLDMLPRTNSRVKKMFSSSNYRFQELTKQYNYTLQYKRNVLHLNNGVGFSDVAQLTGLQNTDWSWSVLFADFDNDSRKDIAITNGFPKDLTDRDFVDFRSSYQSILTSEQEMLKLIPIVHISNFMFQNLGDLDFIDVTDAWGMNIPSFSNGAATADLDNDGDLDYIVNNIDTVAFVYENRNSEIVPSNYIRIKLHGTAPNIDGIGAQVRLYHSGKQQYAQNYPYRGYLSSVESILHFGLGTITTVDSLNVLWSDGKIQNLTNVKANQILQVYQSQAISRQNPAPVKGTIFEKSTDIQFSFQHRERLFFDFDIQRLIQRLYSREGPGLAVGDLNGDGLDDLVVGQGAGQPTEYFLQDEQGNFKSDTIANSSPYEDMGMVLADFDKDGDLDLYVVSGSTEFIPNSENCQDRLYKNDGNGRFTRDVESVPKEFIPGSCVSACDIDADGDLDLFVGGRILIERYPQPPPSMILRNEGGKFVNATKEVAPELEEIGMVMSAIWTDFNNDHHPDLVVVGEWMPITFLEWRGGKWVNVTQKAGTQDTKGWWYSITSGDYDADGDMDYIIGNQGRNTHYRPEGQAPLYIVSKDLDNNNSIDPILFGHRGPDMRIYPLHFRNDMIGQMLSMRERFPKYADYAEVHWESFFQPKDMIQGSYQNQAHTFETLYLENQGGGQFRIQTLPKQVQFSATMGMVSEDFDGDGHLDLLAIGNDYGRESFSGRQDASVGSFLKGNGNGTFTYLNPKETGFYVDGDARALSLIRIGKDTYGVLAAENSDSLKFFTYPKTKQSLTDLNLSPLDFQIVIQENNGKRRVQELYYGSSYLSQLPRRLSLDLQSVKSVEVYDFQGKSRKVK